MSDPHPLWRHLPQEQRTRFHKCRLETRRSLSWVKRRQQKIKIIAILYVAIWAIPWLLGQPIISIFAYIPLILVPPVGWLVFRLVWHEFHG